MRKLNHFKIDKERHRLVVDAEFYQMNLIHLVNDLKRKEADLFADGDDSLPSWTKFSKNPHKAKSFWRNMLRAIFLGESMPSRDELNLTYQTNSNGSGVYMMFLPGGMRNENLLIAGQLAKDSLPEFDVVCCTGANGVTNKKSESIVNSAILDAKQNNRRLLILSVVLAQRSFSVGEIDTVLLAYDGGQEGATIQKCSRCLTPEQVNKVGRIVSLSFDPNRDDKFDAMLLDTAARLADKRNMGMEQAVRLVINSIPLFMCDEHGSVRFNPDDYLNTMIVNNRLKKQLGNSTDPFSLSLDIIEPLMAGVMGGAAAKQAAAEIGKTFADKANRTAGKKTRGKKPIDANLEILKRVLRTIAENIDVIVYGANSRSLNVAFAKYDKQPELANELLSIFGVGHSVIRQAIADGAINRKLLELIKF